MSFSQVNMNLNQKQVNSDSSKSLNVFFNSLLHFNSFNTDIGFIVRYFKRAALVSNGFIFFGESSWYHRDVERLIPCAV